MTSSNARTPSSSSSPTWPRTTCRSRCGWWRATCSCCDRRYGDKLDAGRRRVHRLRRRRRDAHAAADQRPAGLFARRDRGASRSSRSTLRRGRSTGRWRNLKRRHRGERRAGHARPAADRAARDDRPAGAAVPEPDRQRDQVPRRRAAPDSRVGAEREAASGSSRCATTASASTRSTSSGSS